MTYLPQLAMAVLLGAAIYLIFKRIRFISSAISLGKDFSIKGDRSTRLKNMWRLAFGQQKMFDKPIVGLMHFIIYASFLIVNIEVLEIILDGLSGKHRLFAPFLGTLYPILISFFEVLAFGVLATCVVFLIRRNALRVPRLSSLTKWPKLDGNLILVFEIILMAALLTMNAADTVLQTRGLEHYDPTGPWLISGMLLPIFESWDTASLLSYERAVWWLHITGILAFAVYVTYSKHLHIALAFPNTYYKRLQEAGKMTNMEDITQEVKIMLGMAQDNPDAPQEAPSFGAKDVNQLNWKHLMDAFTCTECGRCTEQCPANITGKKLSPRKIMMDTRDRAEEATKLKAMGKDPFDGSKSLLGDYTSEAEILACTSCNACVEACPVGINPLDIILEQRRHMALEASSTPASWNAMFQAMENSFAPWAFSANDRFKWADEIKKDN